MFAALSATNEAILYARSPEQLFQQVCDAALASGDFQSTAVFLLRPGTSNLELAAGAGQNIEQLRTIDISVDASRPEGTGLCGQAFRDQRPCVSNDYTNDVRSLAWRERIAEQPIGALAALPLLRNGRSVGVLCVSLRDAGTLDHQTVSLLMRMSENVSFALDNFDHAEQKAKAEEQKDRLARMFEALGATNEAIMRAKTRAELFELVCEAAVVGGKFTSTTIALAKPGDVFLRNGCIGRPRSGERKNACDVGRRLASRGTGYHRNRVPHTASLHQQRLSGRLRQRTAHFSKAVRRRRNTIGCGIAVAEGRQSRSAFCCSCPASLARSAPN